MCDSQCPAAGQCPMTLDDRALLLPRDSPGVDGNVASADSHTQVQTKSCLVDAACDVYTITDDSLPTHMRSLLPSHEKHVHDLLTLERTRQRLRYVILGLTAMLALTVAVAVTLGLSLKVTPGSVGMEGSHFRVPFPMASVQGKEATTEVRVSLLDDHAPARHSVTKARYRHVGGPKSGRTPCVKECWSYAAFRFRSVCQNGFCLCGGEKYDPYTCLPIYGNCHIEKRFPSQSSAKLFGQNQTSYVCHAPSFDAESIHVVSIFGNHRAATTHVTIKNASPSSKTLVLVNYHFVQWTVQLPEGSGVTKVILVSMKRSNQAKSVILLGPSENPDVEVEHKLSLTGYGEDQHGGHTPRLLQFIEEQVGPLTSFLGASHAEHIVLDLKESARNTTMTSAVSGDK